MVAREGFPAGETEEKLVEEREENMVSFCGEGEPIKRIGHFLKHSTSSTKETTGVPFAPPPPRPLPRRPLKARFMGWMHPQKRWDQWVAKLEPTHNRAWKEAGIYGAIKASACRIRRYPELVLGLVEYWCPQTNTFVFPWSEATPTLEDVAVLGGFPLLGEPAKMMGPLIGELEEMHENMVREHKKFFRRASRRPNHSEWINRYMDEEVEDGRLEHVAFLSLWLSRYVFPAPTKGDVGNYVFPIAIRLAWGARIAFAPAVLASLYRDLRVLRRHAEASACVVWAPFQILQLWVWERFLSLRPKTNPHPLSTDEPRAARWDGLGEKLELSAVNSAFNSADDFRWRPYVVNFDKWQRPSFYRPVGEWIHGGLAKDEELVSFARCLKPCELVGLDCIEHYLPHRVAMQFGFDQDLPGNVPRANTTWELAWATYDTPVRKVEFYVPPRLLESDVTQRFYIWWKLFVSAGNDAVAKASGQQSALKSARRLPKKTFRNEGEKQKLKDIVNIPLSKWLSTLEKPSTRTRSVRERQTCRTKGKECAMPKLSTPPSSTAKRRKRGRPELSTGHRKKVRPIVDASEQFEQVWEMGDTSANELPTVEEAEEVTADVEATKGNDITEIKDLERRKEGESSTSTPIIIEVEDHMEDGKGKSIGATTYNPIVIEDTEGPFPVEHRGKENRAITELPKIKSQIGMIKEQIAGLEARVMGLKSKFQ